MINVFPVNASAMDTMPSTPKRLSAQLDSKYYTRDVSAREGRTPPEKEIFVTVVFDLSDAATWAAVPLSMNAERHTRDV